MLRVIKQTMLTYFYRFQILKRIRVCACIRLVSKKGQGSICATPEGPTHSEKKPFMYRCTNTWSVFFHPPHRSGVDLHFHMVVKKRLFVLTPRISLQPNFSQKSKLFNRISLPVFFYRYFPELSWTTGIYAWTII